MRKSFSLLVFPCLLLSLASCVTSSRQKAASSANLNDATGGLWMWSGELRDQESGEVYYFNLGYIRRQDSINRKIWLTALLGLTDSTAQTYFSEQVTHGIDFDSAGIDQLPDIFDQARNTSWKVKFRKKHIKFSLHPSNHPYIRLRIKLSQNGAPHLLSDTLFQHGLSRVQLRTSLSTKGVLWLGAKRMKVLGFSDYQYSDVSEDYFSGELRHYRALIKTGQSNDMILIHALVDSSCRIIDAQNVILIREDSVQRLLNCDVVCEPCYEGNLSGKVYPLLVGITSSGYYSKMSIKPIFNDQEGRIYKTGIWLGFGTSIGLCGVKTCQGRVSIMIH